MAALYFSFISFIVFLVLNFCNLSKVHQDYSVNGTYFIGKPCSFNLIVKRRNFNRRAVPSRPISVWQKHGEICLLLPYSHIDITVAMDVEIQPGPSNQIHRFITSNNLYATSPHISAFSIAVGNFNFPAKSSLNYSTQHLLDLDRIFLYQEVCPCL